MSDDWVQIQLTIEPCSTCYLIFPIETPQSRDRTLTVGGKSMQKNGEIFYATDLIALFRRDQVWTANLRSFQIVRCSDFDVTSRSYHPTETEFRLETRIAKKLIENVRSARQAGMVCS
jgi:uncharacterized protein (DUF1684 family)